MLRREGLGTNDVEKCKSLKVAANSAYQSMKKKAADFLWDCRHNKAETALNHTRPKSSWDTEKCQCVNTMNDEGVDEELSVYIEVMIVDHLQE